MSEIATRADSSQTISPVETARSPRPVPKGFTPWRPGQSGNPGGRPKGIQDLRALCRAHTHEAVGVLVKLVRDPKAPETARIAAAQALLERGWGRPVQPTETLGPDGKAVDPRVQIAFIVEK